MGKESEMTFLKRCTNGKKHMKRWSTSLVIREMHIQNTRYHFTPPGWLSPKKKKSDNKSEWGTGIRTLMYCWREYKMVQSLWKTTWWFFKQLKHSVTIWSSNSISRYGRKRNEKIYPQKYLYMNVYSSLIHNKQKMETNQTMNG